MTDLLHGTLVPLIYLLSAVLFILGLKRMTRVPTARQGNRMSALAMLLAVVGTLLELGMVDYRWIIAGLVLGSAVGAFAALRVPMTSMPELVALLNGSGGLSSAAVALSTYAMLVMERPTGQDIADAVGGLSQFATFSVALSILIGGLTFTGSIVAWAKLQGRLNKGNPIILPGRHVLNALLAVLAIGMTVYATGFAPDGMTGLYVLLGITLVSFILGFTLVAPIGGADMPVVVSLLNSYSGLAAAAAGFVVGSPLLIIGGSMVGAAGIILTQIMCVAMNRSLISVLLGGFGMEAAAAGDNSEYGTIKRTGAAEAAMDIENAATVCIIPGYGLAVAQAQHTIRELAKILEERGAEVTFAIHPVAGRMPGHMNVLLAEADVPYEQLIELETANPRFRSMDAVIVVGANDVVNPAAIEDPTSPIAGMPILHAHEARSIYVIKRSLSPGYAGIKNPLFEHPRNTMIFGDAKQVLEEMIAELKSAD